MAFTKIASVQEVPPGTAKQVAVGQRTLALFNVSGTYYAIDNTCPHRGAPLSEGEVIGGAEVVCPWHGARFSLSTGAHQCPPAQKGVTSYPVQVTGNEVQADVPA